jgi:hypothetical protein
LFVVDSHSPARAKCVATRQLLGVPILLRRFTTEEEAEDFIKQEQESHGMPPFPTSGVSFRWSPVDLTQIMTIDRKADAFESHLFANRRQVG